MPFWLNLPGIYGRSTLALDTPGAIRFQTYVETDGTSTQEEQWQIKLLNNTGSSTAEGECYTIGYDGDEETNLKLVVPATNAVGVDVVVATGVVANNKFGWFVCKGWCRALVEGTTDVAKDDFLKAVNAQKYLVKDAATESAKSVAISSAAQAADSAVLTKVYVQGNKWATI